MYEYQTYLPGSEYFHPITNTIIRRRRYYKQNGHSSQVSLSTKSSISKLWLFGHFLIYTGTRCHLVLGLAVGGEDFDAALVNIGVRHYSRNCYRSVELDHASTRVHPLRKGQTGRQTDGNGPRPTENGQRTCDQVNGIQQYVLRPAPYAANIQTEYVVANADKHRAKRKSQRINILTWVNGRITTAEGRSTENVTR